MRGVYRVCVCVNMHATVHMSVWISCDVHPYVRKQQPIYVHFCVCAFFCAEVGASNSTIVFGCTYSHI
jgi:hypothetical protein